MAVTHYVLNVSEEPFKHLKIQLTLPVKYFIDTTDIEPLCTVPEFQNLYLRSADVNDGNCQEEILGNTKITEEDYFVAPPGNIPTELSDSIEKRSEFQDD